MGQTLNKVYSSLLAQLLRGRLAPSDEINEKHASGRTQLTDHDLAGMITSQMKLFHKVYMVADALDECANASRFLKFCKSLPENNARLLFTSRRLLSLGKAIEANIELEISADANDIKQYLKRSFEDHDHLNKMVNMEEKGNPGFLDRVLNDMVAKSDRM
jgi:hypothetical protein